MATANNFGSPTYDGNTREWVEFEDVPLHSPAFIDCIIGRLPSKNQFYDLLQGFFNTNRKTNDVDKLMPRRSRIQALQQELTNPTAKPAGYPGRPENHAQWRHMVKTTFELKGDDVWKKGKAGFLVRPLEEMYWRLCEAHITSNTKEGFHGGRDATYNAAGKSYVQKVFVRMFTDACPGCIERLKKSREGHEKRAGEKRKRGDTEGDGEEGDVDSEARLLSLPPQQQRPLLQLQSQVWHYPEDPSPYMFSDPPLYDGPSSPGPTDPQPRFTLEPPETLDQANRDGDLHADYSYDPEFEFW